jgi:hypothetical protein
LALDGRVRPVKGVLPSVLAAKREGGVVGRRRTALFSVLGCAMFTSKAGRRVPGGTSTAIGQDTFWPCGRSTAEMTQNIGFPGKLLQHPHRVRLNHVRR